jgi:hypothetical protein
MAVVIAAACGGGDAAGPGSHAAGANGAAGARAAGGPAGAAGTVNNPAPPSAGAPGTGGAAPASPGLGKLDFDCSLTKGMGAPDSLDPDGVIDSKQQLTLWLPCTTELRGILFMNFGSPFIEDRHKGDPAARMRLADEQRSMHELAALWHFAYVNGGSYWPHADPPAADYLQGALAEWAASLKRPELVNLAFATVGVSRFSNFPHDFAKAYPGRVIVFGTPSGYLPPTAWDPAQSTFFAEVPGIYLPAERESTAVPDLLSGIVRWRAAGARFAVAPAWGAQHGTYSGFELSLPCFDHVIRARVPRDADPRRGPIPLASIAENTGWLGSYDDYKTLARFADWKGDRSKAAWFPDEGCARVWVANELKDAPVRIEFPSGFDDKPLGGDEGKPVTLVASGAADEIRFEATGRVLGTARKDGDGKLKLTVTLPAGHHGIYASLPDGTIVSRPQSFTVSGDFYASGR